MTRPSKRYGYDIEFTETDPHGLLIRLVKGIASKTGYAYDADNNMVIVPAEPKQTEM